MELDFCVISTGLWFAICAASILWGAVMGVALQWLVTKSGSDPSDTSITNFSVGCLLPVLGSFLSTRILDGLLPDDPCGGAFTADAKLVPFLVFFLASLGAIAPFLIKVWRK